MGFRPLFALLLLGFCCWTHTEASACVDASVRSCAECILLSERCGWCSDEHFPQRCDDLQSLARRKCRTIENPRGSVTVEKNEPVTDAKEKPQHEEVVQVQPQKISLNLRSGEPQTFSLKFKRAEVDSIDLYFLLDLSSSMKDDLENLKILGTALIMEMKKITSDFRIGLGSMEQTSDQSCSGTQNCPRTVTFRNLLKLTDKGEEFNLKLSQQQIRENTGSVENMEGGIDINGIQQVALCEEQIGWRSGLRLLVVSTDHRLHVHRDRTLLAPQCELQNHAYTYTLQNPDPSLEQRPSQTRTSAASQNNQTEWAASPLASELIRHNIQSVFAVSENLLPLYQELKYQIPKAAVGARLFNSSNMVELILEAYASLSSEVIMENSRLPEGVWISFKSLCKNGEEGLGERGRQCFNVSIGDQVMFEVSMAAQSCSSPPKSAVVKIKALGLEEEVEVVLNFCISECQCSAQREAHSDRCSRNGTLECGACSCDPGWMGFSCECSEEDSGALEGDSGCRSSPTSGLCSNNGDCVCGSCECKKRENPEERYSGRFCECDNFNCDRSGNKLCGGHGRCECRMCICDQNWTGSACDCSLDVSSCYASNGQICNGRGSCECGVCRCTDPKFMGPTCETCPTCPGVCGQHKDCVQCRAFGSGPKASSCESDCGYLTLTTVDHRESLPQPGDHSYPLSHCKERDQNDCWFYFTYSLRDGRKEVHAVKNMDCPAAPSLLDILG